LFILYRSCYDVFPRRLFPSLKEGLDFSLLIFWYLNVDFWHLKRGNICLFCPCIFVQIYIKGGVNRCISLFGFPHVKDPGGRLTHESAFCPCLQYQSAGFLKTQYHISIPLWTCASTHTHTHTVFWAGTLLHFILESCLLIKKDCSFKWTISWRFYIDIRV
jgi:hypothetical protein